jgi:cobaltochelatase CobT
MKEGGLFITIKKEKAAEMSQDHDPVENFKQATQATARALAGREDVEVVFGGHLAELEDKTIHLPALPRQMDPALMPTMRGLADGMALKLHYHDPALHQKLMPADGGARAIYAAMEEARIEAVGTAHYPGAAGNIAAALGHNARQQNLDKITGMDDAPLADALRFFARESFTGRATPPEAQALLKAWKPWIREHLGPDGLERLKASLHDQEAFAKLSHDLIKKMDMPDALAEPPAPSEVSEAEENKSGQGSEQETAHDARPEGLPPEGMGEEDDKGEAAEQDIGMEGSDLNDMEGEDSLGDARQMRRNAQDEASHTPFANYKI